MIKLFESYSDLDIPITEVASKNKLFLIGGTAINIWSKKLNIPSWRKRSEDDLDFWTFRGNSKLKIFNNFLLENGFVQKEFDSYFNSFRNEVENIDVDILIDFDLSHKKYGVSFNTIATMHPVYLFVSKFDRYLNTNSIERKNRDYKDLQLLLHIIVKTKTVNSLENLLTKQNYSTKEEIIINTLINETFSK
jgi:hypothetical protein